MNIKSLFKPKPKEEENSEFYSLKRICAAVAAYYIIFGERSNGKTYAVQKRAAEKFWKGQKDGSGKGQLGVVRRWKDDFTGNNGQAMFEGICANDEIKKITNGEWTTIYYYSSKWYFSRINEKGERECYNKPFAYGFYISGGEHYKSTSYPDITTILFDEFMTRGSYLPDEFVMFMNIVSTIARRRTDIEIFMLGNTVNKYCPYFNEMGLTHISEQQQGTIDEYTCPNGAKIRVEYCANGNKKEKHNFYFCFDNPRLTMITEGAWETDIYPHLPQKYGESDVVYRYFIIFGITILQCEVVCLDDGYFTYIHEKTTPIKNPDKDLIFTLEDTSHKRNIRRNIKKPEDKLGIKIFSFFTNKRVFYSTNAIGEVVRNYLECCDK